MSDALIPASSFEFALEVERNYTALLRMAGVHHQTEPSLGGKLLYAGELVPQGRALLVAGNIAGAASLASSSDPIAQKQAIRDGVADFLVTSLDEALRILKNEIRKHEAVAVCVAVAPEAMEREMQERGVLPDFSWPLSKQTQSLADGLVEEGATDPLAEKLLVRWSVDAGPARWLPRLDVLALDCFCRETGGEAGAIRRWLRLSPRYLGRLAQGFRLVHGTREAANEFVARIEDALARLEFGVAVRVSLNGDAEARVLAPPVADKP